MHAFTYQGHPARIVFGAGALQQLPAELDRLQLQRVLLLCTPGQRAKAEALAAQLGARVAAIHDGAVMHVPVDSAAAGCVAARAAGADATLALGGGSTVGLGKAIALETGLPLVAVPSTYSGSEMSSIWGLTDGGIKRTGRDARVRPKLVIYDPALTLSLPLAVSVTSALNAIAHAAEGLYAPDGNPVLALMAEEGIRACAAALPPLLHDAQDLAARSDALYGAWLCGTVLDGSTMGLHHKLCHTLGGTFNLPHAEVHTVLLPHALAYNAPLAPEAMLRIARALGAPDAAAAPQAVQSLARRHGAPTSLRDIGMPADGLDRAADLAVANPYPNPRPLERDALRALLQRAFEGGPPTS